MRQLTLRMPDQLADDLKAAAGREERSVNALAVEVLTAAVDPEAAGDEFERHRERLRRAGLLLEWEPDRTVAPPSEEEIARARAAMGGGPMLSDLVSEGRGD